MRTEKTLRARRRLEFSTVKTSDLEKWHPHSFESRQVLTLDLTCLTSLSVAVSLKAFLTPPPPPPRMLPELSSKRGVTAAAHDGGWRAHVHPGSARSHVHQLRQLKQQAIEHAPRRVRTSAMDDKPLTPCSARTCTSESSSSTSEWSADEWSYATRGERPDVPVASVGPDVIATMAAQSEAAGALSSSADQRPANDGSHARSEKDHAPPSAATFSPSGSGRGIEELRRRLEALKAEQPMKAEYAAGPLL